LAARTLGAGVAVGPPVRWAKNWSLKRLVDALSAPILRWQRRVRAALSFLLRQPAHQVELVVRPHAGHVGHAVAEAEEGRDGADVPDVFVGEAVAAQGFEIGVADLTPESSATFMAKSSIAFCRGVMSALR
jgi:hypothetical protein